MTKKADIGARLREQREGLGVTQEELAERLGKSRNTIGAWERGDQHPSGEFYSQAHEWGFDVLYILTGARELTPAYGVSEQEAALLDNYRAADERGRAAARAVLSTLAEPAPYRTDKASGE